MLPEFSFPAVMYGIGVSFAHLCGLTLKRDQRTDETAAENPKNDIAPRRRHFRFTSFA
jgi:hypothetical protein